ncbi:MAG: hypothetical protein ACREPG_07155 [Candidatus Binatia bacterium]
MKRKIVKKRLRLAERHVAEILISYFESSDFMEPTEIDDELCYLGFALTYLLMHNLTLYHEQWPHRQRWIDDIEWDSLSVNRLKVFKGNGSLWWGNKRNVAAQMTQTSIVVELRVLKSGRRPKIDYKLTFSSDGILYQVTGR